MARNWRIWTDDEVKRITAKQSDIIRGWLDRIETMPPHVWYYLAGQVIERVGGPLSEVIEKAESPIESLLGLFLAEVAEYVNGVDGWYCELHAQRTVEINGRRYRADFIMAMQDNIPFGDEIQIVIECDGHDYHERTKEQAARDRKRDRAMQAAGYQVFRFTGSEIWSDPRACVDEIRKVVDQIIRPGAQEVPTHGEGPHPQEADQPVGAGQ